MTAAEAADHARKVMVANSADRVREYEAHWTRRPVKEAARYFGVDRRTIGRWRERLGLSGEQGAA